MKKPLFVLASLAVFFPLLASAHATSEIPAQMSDAAAPVGMVGPQAGELASFVLSAVALVVSGIALSRTKKSSYTNANVL